MRDIPSDIFKQFSEMLNRRSVPFGLHQYYFKWLRYYLDYCSKYHLPDKSSKSLTQFLLKLKEKKQTDDQQKQAGHAVSSYLDLAAGYSGVFLDHLLEKKYKNAAKEFVW